MDFATIKEWTINEGAVAKVTNESGAVIWQKAASKVKLTFNIIGDDNGYFSTVGDGEYDAGTTVTYKFVRSSSAPTSSKTLSDIWVLDYAETEDGEDFTISTVNNTITLNKDTVVNLYFKSMDKLPSVTLNMTYTSQLTTNYYQYTISNENKKYGRGAYIPYRKTSASGTASSVYTAFGGLGSFNSSQSTIQPISYYSTKAVLDNSLFVDSKTITSLKFNGIQHFTAKATSGLASYTSISVANGGNYTSSGNSILDENKKVVFGVANSSTSTIGCTSIGDYAYYTSGAYSLKKNLEFTFDSDIDGIGKYAFNNTIVSLSDYGYAMGDIDDTAFVYCGSTTSSTPSYIHIKSSGGYIRDAFKTQMINSTSHYWKYCADL